jgi:alcohol dehydrogenase
VIVVPSDVDLGVVALVGCAVTTGIGAVWNAGKVRPGDAVAVFGCGGVGMSAILGARFAGANPIVAVDLVPEKLERALTVGATDTVLWSEDSATTSDRITASTAGGVDCAIDATGRTEVLRAAYLATRKGGRTVLVGLPAGETELTIPVWPLLRGERVLTASAYGSWHPRHAIPMLVELYRTKRLPLYQLVSHRMPLADINRGFDLMRSGESVRAVLEMG